MERSQEYGFVFIFVYILLSSANINCSNLTKQPGIISDRGYFLIRHPVVPDKNIKP